MIEDHRKLHQSAAHYETRMLKKYFLQWQIWLTQQRQAKELEQDQRSVRDKMSAFLETGKKLALEQKQRKGEEERTSSRLANTTVVRYVLYTDIHISGSIHVFLRMLRSTKICCEEVREGFVPNIPTLVKAFSMLYQSGSFHVFINLFHFQDDMFNQRTKKINNSLPKKDRRIPTEAWQVTRKHLKLTNKQINDMTDTPQGTVIHCSVIQPGFVLV